MNHGFCSNATTSLIITAHSAFRFLCEIARRLSLWRKRRTLLTSEHSNILGVACARHMLIFTQFDKPVWLLGVQM